MKFEAETITKYASRMFSNADIPTEVRKWMEQDQHDDTSTHFLLIYSLSYLGVRISEDLLCFRAAAFEFSDQRTERLYPTAS